MSLEAPTESQEISRAEEIMHGKLGVAGMRQLESQLSIWMELNESPSLPSTLRDRLSDGDTTLPAGTLVHGVKDISLDVLRGIAEKGVMSGELLGVVEDAETHGCADFFKVPAGMSVEDYYKWVKEPQLKGNVRTQRGERGYISRMAVIVDPNAEGLAPLLEKDAYQDPTMSFTRTPSGRDGSTTSAILGGVPRGAIAGLVFSDSIINNVEMMTEVAQLFPETPILAQNGAPILMGAVA